MLVPALDGAVSRNVIVAGALLEFAGARTETAAGAGEIHVRVIAIGNGIANKN
jgi:hypothetical protein